MMSLTFGLFTQVSGLGPLGPLVYLFILFYLFCEILNLHIFISLFIRNVATTVRIRIALLGDSYFRILATPDCQSDLKVSAA